MLRFLLLVSFLLLPFTANAELRLLMFEQYGCYWCARSNEEIAPAYPKTTEGRAAPLQRINIFDDYPENINIKSRPVFTPTFVLIKDGNEVGRIEGYPGDNFFWPLLDRLLEPFPEYEAAKAES
jgi:hypothetical protein